MSLQELNVFYKVLFWYSQQFPDKEDMPRSKYHDVILKKFDIHKNDYDFPINISLNRRYLKHLQDVFFHYIIFYKIDDLGISGDQEKAHFLKSDEYDENRIYRILVSLGNDKDKISMYADALIH
jgi:hypothetical protein